MKGKILLSTAYLPPIEYFSAISQSDEVLIELKENYLKQSYRNRCYILSAHGPQMLTIPVFLGSLHKTPIKDIRIDYSKRWQQVHLRAMEASYNASPYFEYYFENIEKIISKKQEFLFELNMEILLSVLSMLKIKRQFSYTSEFVPVENNDSDLRYKISPKKISQYSNREYLQVFANENGFVPDLSIVDLLFNQGPESVNFF
jgi:hypothetical protein